MSITQSVIYPVNSYGGFNEGADGKRWIDPKNRVYRTMRSQLVQCTRQVIDDSQFEAVDTTTVSNDLSPTSEVGGIHISDQRLTSTRLNINQRTFSVSQTVPFVMGALEFVGGVTFDTINQEGANFATDNLPAVAIAAPQSGVYHIQVTVDVAAYTGVADGYLRLFLGRIDNLAETEFPTPDVISSASFLRKVGDGPIKVQMEGIVYLRFIGPGSDSNHAVAAFFQRPNEDMPVTISGARMNIILIASDS
jgi:hypothetical protein